jgi:hypothetical protein
MKTPYKQNLSIYKKYTNHKYKINSFIGANLHYIRTYNKNIDKNTFYFLNIINNAVTFKNIEENSKDELILKASIIRCTREIFYDTIRSLKNLIDESKILQIAIVCYIIAYKTISAYDYDDFPGFDEFASMINYSTTSNHLKLLEIEILKITKWEPCKKAYKRLIKAEKIF